MNNPRKPIVLPARVHATDALYTYAQYDPSQAAAYLHISRNVCYALLKAEKIAHTKVSAFRVMCSQRDLDGYDATRPHVVVQGVSGLRLAASNNDRGGKKSRYA